ncbi:MAG: sigma-70 family RNA polymerase sigma factor [Acidobacteria bacterium]|nr:sigma-70 family RNA polymerase sigma factor [Acidobacteriota bacterium]
MSRTLPWQDTVASLEPAEAAEDRDLLARLRAGDEAAFELLVRAHSGRLLCVARRYFRNDDDARDAVQDALISAFKSVRSFKGDSRLSTWLHRITVNASLMKLRTASRHPEASLEELLPQFAEDGHHAGPVSSWPSSAEDVVFQAESRAAVRAAIDRLPESARTVLMLRDIEEMDTEEVARMLGITANAVKIRLHRARQALRTLLEPIVMGR